MVPDLSVTPFSESTSLICNSAHEFKGALARSSWAGLPQQLEPRARDYMQKLGLGSEEPICCTLHSTARLAIASDAKKDEVRSFILMAFPCSPFPLGQSLGENENSVSCFVKCVEHFLFSGLDRSCPFIVAPPFPSHLLLV